MSTGRFGYGDTWVVCGPCMWPPGIVINFLSQISRQTYIETRQPRPFEEWIEKGNQRDANLCGAYARPTNERSLVRGNGGYNQGYCAYFAKGCGDWVFAGINGVG